MAGRGEEGSAGCGVSPQTTLLSLPPPAYPDPQPREKPQVGGSQRGRAELGHGGEGSTHNLGCLPWGLSAETFRKRFEILKVRVGSGEGLLSLGGSLEWERPPFSFRFTWKLSTSLWVEEDREAPSPPPSWALSRGPPPRQEPLFQPPEQGACSS